jgi:hypothetical protein
VHQGYLSGLGVFYVTQPSIGQSLWVPGQDRLLTYREFCELLQDPGHRVWLDRLIQFHLDTAAGHTRERTERLIDAMRQLSSFLDDCVGRGHSIQSRLQAEDTALG